MYRKYVSRLIKWYDVFRIKLTLIKKEINYIEVRNLMKIYKRRNK